jgi:type II secretory pathway pseudopilin PulG
MEAKTTVRTVARPTCDGESGFSLLEVMVGMTVLVGGLMGLGMAMVAAYKLDRTSNERKIAMAFASATLERIRGMPYLDIKARPRPNNFATADTVLPYGGFLPDASWGTCASGYSNAVGTVAGAGSLGFRQDLDNDGDEDVFGLYFTRQTFVAGTPGYWVDNYISTSGGFAVKNTDSRLNALTPREGMNNQMARVTFRDTEASTGLIEGSGYWVTIRVFWKGSSGGREEEKLSTFVSR